MKQLNGTVTLAFLEEDNQQRVIFRVIPLCTREGFVFRRQTVDFPDQGSLRIVPDKREQSTFKERMREMGCLCAIHLCVSGKELTKVRQNRNYDPGQGESNQFAIYSDVICEFADDGVFEVFDEGADCSGALSARVLLRRGKVLYGPLDKGTEPDWALLRPFGNDSYLLHNVQLLEDAERCFYWDPEQTVNWRQRKGTLRRGKTRAEEGEPESARAQQPAAVTAEKRTAAAVPVETPPAAETLAEAEQTPPLPVASTPIVPDMPVMPVSHAAPVSPVTPMPPAASAREQRQTTETVPIGTRLAILKEGITFEEQISKLDQPLSDGANLLAQTAGSMPAADETSAPVHFSGTPLMRMGVKTPMPIRRGETFHNVVEHQIREARQESDERSNDYQHIDNPIEALNAVLERTWDNPDIRSQALESLCRNETFTQAFLKQLRLGGRDMKVIQAAQEQLEDIEAERLSLLMQLDAMKNDEKQAREALRASLPQKLREEIAQLEEQAFALRKETENLRAALTALSGEAREQTLSALVENGTQLLARDGDTFVLTPLTGEKRSPAEMTDAVRSAMNRRGFTVNEDVVTEMLLYFAVNDEFCLGAETLSVAERCACALLEGLGLINVTAFTHDSARLAVASLLPDDGPRTPTVEVCPLGHAALTPYGHKTIRLVETGAVPMVDMPLPLAIVPPLRLNGGETAPVLLNPVALESLIALREGALPLLSRGEDWFNELGRLLREQNAALPEALSRRMRAFLTAASVMLHGGFLAAADAAALGWVVPALFCAQPNLEALRPVLENLPRTLAALGIR